MGQSLTAARNLRSQLTLKELVQEANDFHNLAARAAKDTLVHAMESGRRLLEAKAKCQHGQFERLFDDPDGLDMPLRTGQRYMKICREWDEYGLSFGQAANISITEGLAKLKTMKEVYYPPDIAKSATMALLHKSGGQSGKEPVDGTDECLFGGPHQYDGEACIRCHDPIPTQSNARDDRQPAAPQAPPAGRSGSPRPANQPLDRRRDIADRFIHGEHLFGELTRILDELAQEVPYEGQPGMQDALDIVFQSFKKWKEIAK